MAKSKIYFSPNIRQEERDEMCEVLGMSSTPNLGKYLGFPLKHPGSSSHDFDFVLERVQTKVQGWKASLLSMAGWGRSHPICNFSGPFIFDARLFFAFKSSQWL